MDEVKNEGLEIVAYAVSVTRWPWPYRLVVREDVAIEHAENVAPEKAEVQPLCRHSEALAGYAMRDARVAELELLAAAISADCNDMANERDQLRAELAAAKETIARYETTAENCDLLRSAPSAVVMPAVPDGYKLVPIEPTAAQCFTAAFNLCNEFGEEFVRDNKQFAMAAYRWLVAASPAAKGAKQ